MAQKTHDLCRSEYGYFFKPVKIILVLISLSWVLFIHTARARYIGELFYLNLSISKMSLYSKIEALDRLSDTGFNYGLGLTIHKRVAVEANYAFYQLEEPVKPGYSTAIRSQLDTQVYRLGLRFLPVKYVGMRLGYHLSIVDRQVEILDPVLPQVAVINPYNEVLHGFYGGVDLSLIAIGPVEFFCSFDISSNEDFHTNVVGGGLRLHY